MGIDLPEILILLVLALILFGPEKLPEYGAKLGRLIARMRQASSEVTKPLQQALHSGEFPASPPTPPSPYSFLKEDFCHQCGHTLEADFQFCPRCGRRLEKEKSSSPELAS